MTKNIQIDVAIGFDDNYVMQYGVALLSICENTPAYVVFHAILSGNVTEESKEMLNNLVEQFGNRIIYYPIDNKRFDKMPETAHVNKASYNRLFIPNTVPEHIHKILYLDGDIIVTNSLIPLWDTTLEDTTPLAAVLDARASCIKVHNAIDIPLTQVYFNNGVLLLNLDCWRKEKISEKCMDYIIESQCPWMDQDAVNHVVGTRIKMLHPRYNLQIAFVRLSEKEWHIEKKFFTAIKEAKENPVIIHFSEGEKPWNMNCPHSEKWLQYKNKSPWAEVPLYPPLLRLERMWKINDAYNENPYMVYEFFPAYFSFYEKFVNKHPYVFRCVNKLLWVLSKLFVLLLFVQTNNTFIE